MVARDILGCLAARENSRRELPACLDVGNHDSALHQARASMLAQYDINIHSKSLRCCALHSTICRIQHFLVPTKPFICPFWRARRGVGHPEKRDVPIVEAMAARHRVESRGTFTVCWQGRHSFVKRTKLPGLSIFFMASPSLDEVHHHAVKLVVAPQSIYSVYYLNFSIHFPIYILSDCSLQLRSLHYRDSFILSIVFLLKRRNIEFSRITEVLSGY